MASSRTKQLLRFGPWVGGENLKKMPALMGPNEAVLIRNMSVKDDGTLHTPYEPTVIEAIPTYLSNPCTGAVFIGEVVDSNGKTAFIRAYYPAGYYVVYSYVNNHVGATGTFTQILAGATSSAASSCDQVIPYNGTFLLLCGTYGGYTSTGGAATGPVAGVPLGQGGVIFRDRAFVYGAASNPTRLYFSKTTTLTTFTGDPDAGYIDVGEAGAASANVDPIQCVLRLGKSLYILKRKAIYRLDYTSVPTDGSLFLLNSQMGLEGSGAFGINRRGGVEVDTRLFFVAELGLYEILNNSVVNRLADSIDRRIRFRSPAYPVFGFAFSHVCRIGPDKLLIGQNANAAQISNPSFIYDLNTGSLSEYLGVTSTNLGTQSEFNAYFYLDNVAEYFTPRGYYLANGYIANFYTDFDGSNRSVLPTSTLIFTIPGDFGFIRLFWIELLGRFWRTFNATTVRVRIYTGNMYLLVDSGVVTLAVETSGGQLSPTFGLTQETVKVPANCRAHELIVQVEITADYFELTGVGVMASTAQNPSSAQAMFTSSTNV